MALANTKVAVVVATSTASNKMGSKRIGADADLMGISRVSRRNVTDKELRVRWVVSAEIIRQGLHCHRHG